MGVALPARSRRRPYYLHRELFASSFAAMARGTGRRARRRTACEALVDRQYRGHDRRTPCSAPTASTPSVALRERGPAHVQIVSNIDDEQLDGAGRRSSGSTRLIDAWTSSESARSCKPDARIYEFALAKAGCAAAEVLFVGDSVDARHRRPACAWAWRRRCSSPTPGPAPADGARRPRDRASRRGASSIVDAELAA